jgi:hypothetical protein
MGFGNYNIALSQNVQIDDEIMSHLQPYQHLKLLTSFS